MLEHGSSGTDGSWSTLFSSYPPQFQSSPWGTSRTWVWPSQPIQHINSCPLFFSQAWKCTHLWCNLPWGKLTLAPKLVLAHADHGRKIGYLSGNFRFQACVVCSRRGGGRGLLTGWAQSLGPVDSLLHRKDELHNLEDQVQNENAGPLV